MTPAVCRTIAERELDVLIIAGDIAGDYTISASFIQTLRRESSTRCLFVPGNHDIWTESHPRLDSWTIYNRLLEIDGNLASGPVDLDDTWSVTGDLGWFDYSLADGMFSSKELAAMEYGGREWQDHLYAVWDRTPEEMHRFFLEKLQERLDSLDRRKVFFVTHMLQNDMFTVKDDHPQAGLWKYFNGFLGSSDYGALIRSHPNIRVAVSGHVHYRKRSVENGTEYICNCLGYSSEWNGTDDPFVEVPKAILVLDTSDL